jgi:hypothetical protein
VELLGILRPLARRPILVLIGALVAFAAGVLAAGEETKTTGTASARLMLDTARSQLTHDAPTGADTLTWRSVLLAYQAGTRPLTERIAAEVGIRRGELVVVYPDLADPYTPAALPARAAEMAGEISEKYILTVDIDEIVPIISLAAEAPDRGAAARLAAAALRALEDAGTTAQPRPGIQGLSAEAMGPVRSKAVVREPSPLLGPGVAIALFGIWCAGVALMPRLSSGWDSAPHRPRPV